MEDHRKQVLERKKRMEQESNLQKKQSIQKKLDAAVRLYVHGYRMIMNRHYIYNLKEMEIKDLLSHSIIGSSL